MVQEGRSAIQQLQSVAEQFEKGKLEIATTADVRVTGVEGGYCIICIIQSRHLSTLNEMSGYHSMEEVHRKV